MSNNRDVASRILNRLEAEKRRVVSKVKYTKDTLNRESMAKTMFSEVDQIQEEIDLMSAVLEKIPEEKPEETTAPPEEVKPKTDGKSLITFNIEGQEPMKVNIDKSKYGVDIVKKNISHHFKIDQSEYDLVDENGEILANDWSDSNNLTFTKKE